MAPRGFVVSGYTARRGMATAAKSINVPMEEIKWVGGWSNDSQAVHSYIDMGVRPCPAAFLFFGWLLKHSLASPPSLSHWWDAARAAADAVSLSSRDIISSSASAVPQAPPRA